MKKLVFYLLAVGFFCLSCRSEHTGMNSNKNIVIMTLDPGHFHSSLVQKSGYPEVSNEVYVYAPDGPEVQDHLKRIAQYNSREEDPTEWKENVYLGDDFFEKMLKDRPGNLVVLAGNNRKKTSYIYGSIDKGLNVLADKPMAINVEGFNLLREAFVLAEERGVLLYDIMTERFEITTILQRMFSQQEDIFGTLVKGTLEEPAITKESVHHFFKYVSGKPLQRPAWFFDVEQEGEAIADVGTHLVDLIQWEAFPEQIINFEKDIELLSAGKWPTLLTEEQFRKVTGLKEFPYYLDPYIKGENLEVYCNNVVNYTLKGIHAKVSVAWKFEAPEGTGDTHYSVMRGTNCELEIRQGAGEGYKPTLYVRAGEGTDIEKLDREIRKYITGELEHVYPGIGLKEVDKGQWKVLIPVRYRIGHEAHFKEVTNNFLQYLEKGKLPEWEIPNMLAKYYTTTRAVEMAGE